jgi:hypothetical protein
MAIDALILMLAVWSFIIGLTVWCFWKLLSSERRLDGGDTP